MITGIGASCIGVVLNLADDFLLLWISGKIFRNPLGSRTFFDGPAYCLENAKWNSIHPPTNFCLRWTVTLKKRFFVKNQLFPSKIVSFPNLSFNRSCFRFFLFSEQSKDCIYLRIRKANIASNTKLVIWISNLNLN